MKMLICAALLAAAPALAAPATTVAASGAWVRLPAVPGRPGAGYLVLDGGARGDRLTGASSPLAARIELHATAAAGGAMRMTPLREVAVKPGGRAAFAPGGNHLMLFGLRPVPPGATVPLVLRFASGATLKVAATARAAGEALPDPHAQH